MAEIEQVPAELKIRDYAEFTTSSLRDFWPGPVGPTEKLYTSEGAMYKIAFFGNKNISESMPPTDLVFVDSGNRSAIFPDSLITKEFVRRIDREDGTAGVLLSCGESHLNPKTEKTPKNVREIVDHSKAIMRDMIEHNPSARLHLVALSQGAIYMLIAAAELAEEFAENSPEFPLSMDLVLVSPLINAPETINNWDDSFRGSFRRKVRENMEKENIPNPEEELLQRWSELNLLNTIPRLRGVISKAYIHYALKDRTAPAYLVEEFRDGLEEELDIPTFSMIDRTYDHADSASLAFIMPEPIIDFLFYERDEHGTAKRIQP